MSYTSLAFVSNPIRERHRVFALLLSRPGCPSYVFKSSLGATISIVTLLVCLSHIWYIFTRYDSTSSDAQTYNVWLPGQHMPEYPAKFPIAGTVIATAGL